ncbi:MAG: glycosyltransferase family 2 protein [Oscillochloris sp.]|nr:glycosyltransferase family 2 protein [Oscillochloris sp.]
MPCARNRISILPSNLADKSGSWRCSNLTPPPITPGQQRLASSSTGANRQRCFSCDRKLRAPDDPGVHNSSVTKHLSLVISGSSHYVTTLPVSSFVVKGCTVRLSVIIPCYNAADTLGEQLDSLACQEWDQPWEVIVADNGSSDNSRAMAEAYLNRIANLRIIDASARKGGAFARNEAVRYAQSDAIVFIDADDVAAPGWVAAIGNALEHHAFVASRFDIEHLNHQSWISRTRSNPQAEGVQRISYPPHLPHSGGCGLGVRRALHEQIGGFDESLLRLMDTDYCFRIQLQSNVELTFVPDATVYVRYRDTLSGMFRQTRERAAYNVFLAARYRPAGQSRSHLRAWYRLIQRWFRLWLRLFTKVRSREQFAEWLRVLGWQIGLIQGSLKYKVPPL